ncbi:MAG: T9SS type A sorting domain-containing protein [Flavobacterium sp.]
MKIPTYQIVLLLLMCTITQGQKIQWEKSYGGNYSDYLMDVQPTADYGFILAGSSLSNKSGNKSDDGKGDFDYWLWKMDETGHLEWQKSFGGYGSDFLQSIRNTNDGGIILGGTSNSSDEPKNILKNDKKEKCRGGDDFWIIKLDAKGNEEWQKTFGGIGQDKLKTICPTADGGYIIGGSSNSNLSDEKKDNCYGGMDYWVIKIDFKGGIQWQKTFGGIYNDELQNIEQTKDNGYIVGGTSNSPLSGNKSCEHLGFHDYWIIKLNNNGAIQWQKTIGGILDDRLTTIHQTYDTGYVLGGSSSTDATKSKKRKGENGTDFMVVKIDGDGKILWQQNYNIGDHDVLNSLIENKDHTLLLGGYAQSEVDKIRNKEENGINDYVAIKISENGDELWRKSVGSTGEDVLQKAIETRDGGYILAGTSNPSKCNNLPLLDKSVSSKALDSRKTNTKLQEYSNDMSKTIDDKKNQANDYIKDSTHKLNNLIGGDRDSAIKTSIPNSKLENLTSSGTSNSLLPSSSSQKQPLPSSKDKKSSFGSNDFWVVKLKDNDKPPVAKKTIEALPNPANNFTNIILGYDYESGTATLADLSGRVLQTFSIKGKTVPIDLHGLPEGIYVVNIITYFEGKETSEGVKIIKE